MQSGTSMGQLALWVKGGLANNSFVEDRRCILNPELRRLRRVVVGCVLGAAAVGKCGDAQEAVRALREHEANGFFPTAFPGKVMVVASFLGIPYAVGVVISKMHSAGTPIAEIADTLERDFSPDQGIPDPAKSEKPPELVSCS